MIRAKISEVREAVAAQVSDEDSRRYIGKLLDYLNDVVVVALSGKTVDENTPTSVSNFDAKEVDDAKESDVNA